MVRQGRKVVAVLADYPFWIHIPELEAFRVHPAAWLAAVQSAFSDKVGIAEAYEQYELHWVVLTKAVKKERTVELDSHYLHLLPGGSRTLSQFLRYWPNRLRVHRFLKRLKPDLVHAWGTESAYGICAKDYKGPKLFSVQGLINACIQRSAMSNFMVRLAKFEKETLASMPVITAESEWARERVLELVPQADVRIWDYAVEPRFFTARKEMSPKPTCLLAGTNSLHKNVPLAIRAFSRPELRHVTLFLAGVAPGEYQNLPENIIPLGRVGRDRMVELLQEAWLLVHPSLVETGPTIVKEARVMGVPCVLSVDCGAKRYIAQGKSGYIIEPNNEQQLVDAVLAVTKDMQTALAMGVYEQDKCRTLLSEKEMIKGLLSLYREILSRR